MKKTMTETLETDRLILRKFRTDDAEGIFRNWESDPECSKFLDWEIAKDVEETKSIVQSWINAYETGSYNWIVELKNSGEVIGSISVIKMSETHLTAEIGYCYGSSFWGNGYVTEALKAVIDYLLNKCGFYLIEARHISGNPASGRVMEKAGMRRDAVLRSRKINKHTKERNDVIVYSITQTDFTGDLND